MLTKNSKIVKTLKAVSTGASLNFIVNLIEAILPKMIHL